MDQLQIIGTPRSTYVRMVRLAAEEKGVPYELVSVAPRSPEALAVHPLGRVPGMRHGNVTLCESRAIVTYIDGTFPGPRLLPESPHARALIEQWVSLLHSAYELAPHAYFGAYFFPGTSDGSPDRSRIQAVLGELERVLTLIDGAVAERGHIVGAEFTLADMAVLPALTYLADLPESAAMIAARPPVGDYIARHAARPSMKATATPPPGARSPEALAAA